MPGAGARGTGGDCSAVDGILTESQIAEKYFERLEGLACELVQDLPEPRAGELLELLDDIDAERNGYCRCCDNPRPLGFCHECGNLVEDLRA